MLINKYFNKKKKMKLLIFYFNILTLLKIINAIEFNVRNSSDLSKAIKKSSPGDIINLADGIYDSFKLVNKNGTKTNI